MEPRDLQAFIPNPIGPQEFAMNVSYGLDEPSFFDHSLDFLLVGCVVFHGNFHGHVSRPVVDSQNRLRIAQGHRENFVFIKNYKRTGGAAHQGVELRGVFGRVEVSRRLSGADCGQGFYKLIRRIIVVKCKKTRTFIKLVRVTCWRKDQSKVWRFHHAEKK